jgi:hypothetical protein
VRLLRKSVSNAGIVVRRLFAVAASVDQIATALTA